jgi:hypothetical protein
VPKPAAYFNGIPLYPAPGQSINPTKPTARPSATPTATPTATPSATSQPATNPLTGNVDASFKPSGAASVPTTAPSNAGGTSGSSTPPSGPSLQDLLQLFGGSPQTMQGPSGSEGPQAPMFSGPQLPDTADLPSTRATAPPTSPTRGGQSGLPICGAEVNRGLGLGMKPTEKGYIGPDKVEERLGLKPDSGLPIQTVEEHPESLPVGRFVVSVFSRPDAPDHVGRGSRDHVAWGEKYGDGSIVIHQRFDIPPTQYTQVFDSNTTTDDDGRPISAFEAFRLQKRWDYQGNPLPPPNGKTIRIDLVTRLPDGTTVRVDVGHEDAAAKLTPPPP